ncbi:MAG: alpha/beta hydrolase [Acidimicrobiia bacterium]|nr:alpha/beta hydrolase [Acidimicrobiia bacterium]
MFWPAVAVVLMSVPIPTALDGAVPGDGIGLAPNPIIRSSSASTTPGPRPSRPLFPTSIPFAAGTAAALGASVVFKRRRNDDPLVVVVHGDGGSPESFRSLTDAMGIPTWRVVAFDYSTVDGGASSTASSHRVSTADAADRLDAMLRELSMDNANIYTVHHSRGGAVGAELIADLDEGSRPPIDGYRGAALLDPAIAAGPHGWLQSLGGSWPFGMVPDDGGFDPIRCTEDGCRDIRAHLGESAGVEVVAIRNTDAVLPNFWGRPEGLRVFDVRDLLPSAALLVNINPVLALLRMSQAHNSVLKSGAVAQCVRAEIDEPGSCTELYR